MAAPVAAAVPLLTAIAPSMIGAGGALLGGLMSAGFSQKATRRAEDWNTRAADKAMAQQRENYWEDVRVNRENFGTQVAVNDRLLAEQRFYDSPTEVRKRAEAGGFNPLSYAGNFSSSGVTAPSMGGSQGFGASAPTMAAASSGYMGAAVADAGMILADGLARRQDLARASALEQENEELAKKVTALTLRPEIGGVYARRAAIPSTAQALGVRDASSASGVVASDPPSDMFGEPVTRVSFAGIGAKPDTGYSDAELYETRYGEVGGSVLGLGVLAADARSTLKAKSNRTLLQNYREFPNGRRPFTVTPTPAVRRYSEKIGPQKWDKNGSAVSKRPWNYRAMNYGAMFQ